MNPVQSAGKSTKNLAKQIAKQIAQEPLEVLKTAREQTFGPETFSQPDSLTTSRQYEQNKEIEAQQKAQDRLKAGRRMEALSRELDDIEKQKLFSDLQRRISQGEEVPLEEYPELSIEQRQVLRAQMEAVRVQMENRKLEDGKSLNEPAVKKGRQLFNFGKKTAAMREQTHVEKPVPPSG